MQKNACDCENQSALQQICCMSALTSLCRRRLRVWVMGIQHLCRQSARSPLFLSQHKVPGNLLSPAVLTLKYILHHHDFFILTFSQVPSESWGRAEYKLYQKQSGQLRTSPSQATCLLSH